MKIEWYEKHELEINNDTLKDLAMNMDNYGKGYGGDLVEDCLAEWMGEIERYNVYQYIDNWKEIVATVKTEVMKYKS